MKIEELFNELIELDVHVGLQGDDISIKGLKKEYAPVLIPKIKEHKNDLIAYLKSLENISHTSFSSIDKVPQAASYPLSPSQYRLWIISQFEEASIAYNIPTRIMLNGDYDIACLQKAIHAVIERHEILRTVFKENGVGELRQWVLPKATLNFEISYIDYSEKDKQDVVVDTYIAEDSIKPFDLINGPLLRVSLLKKAANSYVLYYNMHHIISDGWSMNVLMDDVLVYYEAYKTNIEPKLSALRIQYKDYATWQLQQLESDKQEEHKSFWLQQLKGNIPLLDLPSEKLRPRVMTYNGRNFGSVISVADTQNLKAYCKDNGGSLFMGIIAVWNVLLSKYTSQNTIILGTPVSGRNHLELENQIGFYVNTLLLKNEVDQQLTFDTFFKKIVKNTLTSFEHQDYPFDSILEDLQFKKDISRNSLFDVMITIANPENTTDETTIPIDEKIVTDNGECLAKFDLDVSFQEIAGQLHFNITYNTDVYDSILIQNLLKHYKSLLKHILEDSNKNINELEYLSPEDRDELLNELNHLDAVEYPQDQTILDLLRTQVDSVPNNLAVSFEETSLSFKELDEISNQLANFLTDTHTIALEDFIGMQLDRSEWIIISFFAILKLGAVYLPINPTNPEDRIEYIKEDSKCKLIIDAELIQKFNTVKEQYSTQLNTPEIQSNNLAYVIYTSGSTGQPKGVLVEHGSVVNIHYGWKEAFKLDTFKVNLLQFANFAFDVSVGDICRSILNGGHMIICKDDAKFDQEKLYQLITKHDISMFDIPPALIIPLVEYLQEQNLQLETLKLLIIGGEKITFDKLEILINYFGNHTKIVNSYGVTEASIDSTYFEYHPDYKINRNTNMPIGIPYPNTTVYILDKNNKLVAKGVKGEICLGGIAVTRGYLNKEELTATKFIDDPFVSGGKIYKTGDVGRWLQDGNIEFIGREDDQIKLRGFRIELGEIEKKLLTKPDIDEVVVQVVKAEEADNDQLVAYVTAKKTQAVNELNNYLMTKLPPYMVPNSFYQIDKMPLTPNGKIDKKALLYLSESKKLKDEYVAPRTEEEQVLASIWGKVLHKEQIGVKDNFYSLGGDSIKSIQVISQLKRNGYTLKIDLLLSTPVLENLAKHIKKIDKEIKHFEVTNSIELSPIQQAFIQDPHIKVPNYYNQSIVLKFKETINISKLHIAYEKLVQHHDGLRLRFNVVNNTWIQYLEKYKAEEYVIDVYDLTTVSDPTADMEAIGTKLQESFELKKSALFKMAVFRCNDGDRLALIGHHMIVDGISWRILMEDFGLLYGQTESETEILPFKSNSYLSWVRCQQEYVHKGTLNAEKEIWQQICNTEIQNLPVDFEKSTGSIKINENVSFTVNKATTTLLKTEINGLFNTSINDLLLLGLSTALKQVFGVEKSLIALEGHGREEIDDHIDISRTIGWFTTNYPFVLEASEHSNPLGNLLKLKSQLKQIPKNGIGYGMLKYISKELHTLIHPSIEFNYLGDFDNSVDQGVEKEATQTNQLFEFSSESIGLSTHADNSSNILLLVTGMIVNGELTVTISYGDASYKKTTIQRLVNSFETSLHEIITHLTASKIEIEDIYKLSPRQKWMYNLKFETVKKRNFSQVSYRLKDSGLSEQKIQSAYQRLLSKYTVLRTSFKSIEGAVYQVVHKNINTDNLFFIQAPNTDIEAFIKNTKEEDLLQPFDFLAPALMRLKFIEIKKGEYELIWSFHHIILDGWSISLLVQDFIQLLLTSAANIHPSEINSVKFSNYINWIEAVDTRKTMAYWEKYLNGCTKTSILPLNTGNKEAKAALMHTQTVVLENMMLNEIKEVCARYNITQNIFMQGVWGYLLSKYNQTTDVVFGTLVSGRSNEISDVDNIIGLLTNLIPVRLSYTTNDTPSSILMNLQKSWINGLYHHHVDFSEIEKMLQLNSPLIDNVLVFQNFPTETENIENMASQPLEGMTNIDIEGTTSYERLTYNFNIKIKPIGNTMIIEFSYDNSIYTKEKVENIRTDFLKTIKYFIQNSLESKH